VRSVRCRPSRSSRSSVSSTVRWFGRTGLMPPVGSGRPNREGDPAVGKAGRGHATLVLDMAAIRWPRRLLRPRPHRSGGDCC
jgi:hypothetical protein